MISGSECRQLLFCLCLRLCMFLIVSCWKRSTMTKIKNILLVFFLAAHLFIAIQTLSTLSPKDRVPQWSWYYLKNSAMCSCRFVPQRFFVLSWRKDANPPVERVTMRKGDTQRAKMRRRFGAFALLPFRIVAQPSQSSILALLRYFDTKQSVTSTTSRPFDFSSSDNQAHSNYTCITWP